MSLNLKRKVVLQVLNERQPTARSISIDVSKIPAVLLEEILEAMTAPLTAFYAVPENQEKYKAWLAKRRAAEKE